MDELSKLPNIGKTVEEQLIQVGINSADELKKIGAKEAWLKIQEVDESACIHRLMVLEGVIEGIKKTGETIGSCELEFTDKDPAELAWELHRNYWRKGYGTEIGHTLLKLGFDLLGIRRIIADCNTLNKGSYGIMEKMGMRREAHFVKYYRGNSALNNEWCDKYLYAILQEEYFTK